MPDWLNGKRKMGRMRWQRLQVCRFWPAHPPRRLSLNLHLRQEQPRRRF
jgi:hypothetical protein